MMPGLHRVRVAWLQPQPRVWRKQFCRIKSGKPVLVWSHTMGFGRGLPSKPGQSSRRSSCSSTECLWHEESADFVNLQDVCMCAHHQPPGPESMGLSCCSSSNFAGSFPGGRRCPSSASGTPAVNPTLGFPGQALNDQNKPAYSSTHQLPAKNLSSQI